ncbi:MAG: serine/threonine protein kinase [Actinomycetia bacterium]|nr:serine/threonine protein kinase [Actinomycetes bacterium]
MRETLNPSTPDPQHRGRLLAGRYELRVPVASGGMAQVWAATDHVLSRQVAIKILHPHLAADQTFVSRFRREAVAAARLSHPSIVSIYDTISEPGVEAIVMELIEGTTLRKLLDDQGVLAPASVLDIGAQVAAALQAAHRGGVVHRDVKPANVLMCSDQRVMVTDFGIAKAGEHTDLTREGTLLGTAKYLSPEQVEGSPVDARSDVYSLGVMLYECLTGRPPFDGDSDAAIALARLQRTPVSPGRIRPGVPRDLDVAIMRALARSADGRWQTASDFGASLSSIDLNRADDTLVLMEDDLAAEIEERGEPSFVESERAWMVPTLAVLLIAAGLGVIGVLFARTETGQNLFDGVREAAGLEANDGGATAIVEPVTDDQPEAVAPPTISAAVPFDPFDITGDSANEHPEQAAHAIDGDSATAWNTETYRGRPELGGLKAGVGLVIQLAEPAVASGIVIESSSSSWAASVHVIDGELPDDLDGWGPPVAEDLGLQQSNEFPLPGTPTTAVLIWITHLGEPVDIDDDESDSQSFRVSITEVQLT